MEVRTLKEVRKLSGIVCQECYLSPSNDGELIKEGIQFQFEHSDVATKLCIKCCRKLIEHLVFHINAERLEK